MKASRAGSGRTKDPGRALLPTPRPLRLLAPDGTLTTNARLPLDLKDDDLVALYRFMTITRRVDREAVSLQRQGQVGAYPPNLGQEAAQVGPAYALGDRDWLFPAYRELGAMLVRGVPPSAVVHPFRGTWHSAHDPAANRVGLLCLPIATQTLHATGFAMGAALDDAPIVVLTYLGDGATSEGDAHEAFNFAAVFDAPIVFVIQNNQYAISVPADRQSRGPSLAHRAVGYGMPGVLVDGNDVLACYAATRRAVERARKGEGPTLIEARTYRLDGHSTADDWTRYRTQEEIDAWTAEDPLSRLGRHLRAGGLLDDALDDTIRSAAEDAAARLREEIWDAPAPEPAEIFDHVYAAPPTPVLRRQRARLDAELEAGS
jgi:2-oxoisovalerate dehydrogenase E1 component alpha subunit